MRPSKKKSENGQRVPWISKGILNSRKTKNVLYKNFYRNRNENNDSIHETLSLPVILIYFTATKVLTVCAVPLSERPHLILKTKRKKLMRLPH